MIYLKKIFRPWVIDLFIYIIFLSIIVMTNLGVIPTWSNSGIYCNDTSINFKRQGDTVPTLYLFLGMLLPPFIVIYATELSRELSSSSINQYAPQQEEDIGNVHQLRTPNQRAWTVTKTFYGCFTSGLLFAGLLLEVLKSMVAEARPHFLDTCQPISLNCSYPGQFISYHEIECSKDNSAGGGVPRAITDAMRSFPSGHAQLSTYTAMVMVMYVQQRIGTKYSYLWKHLLQMAFICFALICSISRIIDKRHHWWDVLAGMIIGILFGYTTVVWHANNFQPKIVLSSCQFSSSSAPITCDQEMAETNTNTSSSNSTNTSNQSDSIRHRNPTSTTGTSSSILPSTSN